MVHIYEAMKPQLILQQSISKRISIHPAVKDLRIRCLI